MSATVAERPKPEQSTLTGLAAYVQRCGGKETLIFDTVPQAVQAASELRQRNHENVDIACQYYRVTITLA